MRYIDKNAKRTEGRNITDEYLDNECRTTDQVTGNIRYMNVDYSGSFTNKGYKNKLLELGMALQNKFCCYCLRKIGKNNLQRWNILFLKVLKLLMVMIVTMNYLNMK